MLSDAFVKSEVLCFQACFETEECSSVYYNRKRGYCILYKPFTNEIWNTCLAVVDESDAIHAYFDKEAFHLMVRLAINSMLIKEGYT